MTTILTEQQASEFLGKEVEIRDYNLVYRNGREIYQIVTEGEYDKLGFDDPSDKKYQVEIGENLIFIAQ